MDTEKYNNTFFTENGKMKKISHYPASDFVHNVTIDL